VSDRATHAAQANSFHHKGLSHQVTEVHGSLSLAKPAAGAFVGGSRVIGGIAELRRE
jgi:hypothetical protein